LIAAGKLKGTIRFYGTPAEKRGKVYMARAGLFNDRYLFRLASITKANIQSSQAIADYTITFKGKMLMPQLIRGTVKAL
jgi:aminobenzoyl-glutamate utilization protein B